MAFGAPPGSALTYSTVAPPAVQAAQAAAAAPQANADAAQKLAEAQAGAATAKNTTAEAESKQEADVATNQANLAQAQQQKQTIALSNLARVSGMPKIADSPAGLKMLKTAADAAGLEIPKTVNGLPDIDALKQMTATPTKAFSELSAAEYKDQQARPPADRTNFPGAPADWMSRAAVVPLTEKQLEYFHAPVVKAEAAFAAGKGNAYNMAQNLAMAINTERNIKKQHGESTVDEDASIEPDPNRPGKFRLTEELRRQKAADVAQSDVDKARALGLHWAAQEGAVKRREDERVREWGTPSANARLSAGTAAARASALAAQRSISNAMAQTRIANTDRAFDAAVANKDYDRAAALAKIGLEESDKAEVRKTQTVNMLNNMSSDFMSNHPDLAQQLTDQATADKGYAENSDKYHAAVRAADANRAATMSKIMGGGGTTTLTVNVPPGQNNPTPGAPPGQNYGSYAKGSPVPDQPGYKFSSGKNPDGTYDAVGPDGKVLKWKPA
jgi:hypothetical protein